MCLRKRTYVCFGKDCKNVCKKQGCAHSLHISVRISFLNGPFSTSCSLFLSFQFSWQWTFNLNVCQWLDSNCGPLVSEAIAPPTEPQPLSHIFEWGSNIALFIFYLFSFRFCQFLPKFDKFSWLYLNRFNYTTHRIGLICCCQLRTYWVSSYCCSKVY